MWAALGRLLSRQPLSPIPLFVGVLLSLKVSEFSSYSLFGEAPYQCLYKRKPETVFQCSYVVE